jgi:hypothetical protein
MMLSRWLRNVWDVTDSRKARRRPAARRRLAGRVFVPRLEPLEDRITPTGSITITDISVVDQNGNPLSVENPGELVDIKADFTTQGLPSNASYHISSTVNGFTWGRDLTKGAGVSGTSSHSDVDGPFMVTPGTNQVSISIESSDTSSYTGDSMSGSFSAVPPSVGAL